MAECVVSAKDYARYFADQKPEAPRYTVPTPKKPTPYTGHDRRVNPRGGRRRTDTDTR